MTKEDHYIQGMEAYADDRVDEAIESYNKALADDPDYADALHALGMAYANTDRLDEAIEVGKRLIEVSPDDELAYTSLSIFYQRKGDDRGGRSRRRQGQDPGVETAARREQVAGSRHASGLAAARKQQSQITGPSAKKGYA